MVKRYKPHSNTEREIYNFVRFNFGVELEKDAFGLDISVLTKDERIKISKDSKLGTSFKEYERVYTARKNLNLPVRGEKQSRPLMTEFDRVARARRTQKLKPLATRKKRQTVKPRSSKTRNRKKRHGKKSLKPSHHSMLHHSKKGRFNYAKDKKNRALKSPVNRPQKIERPIEKATRVFQYRKTIKKSRRGEIDINVPDLSLKKLRKGRVRGVPAIIAMTDAGRFDEVVELSLKAKDKNKLDIQDFTTADPYGALLINVLIDRGELEKAFDPRLWQGRTDKMRHLWDKVLQKDDRKKASFDFDAMMGRALLLTQQGRTPPKRPRLK